ncbi:MAG: glycine zipper 2TM domain-containing protein [Patescibacteria group bacterium]
MAKAGGAIVGGAIGAAVGGPLGAVIGAVVGAALGSDSSTSSPQEARRTGKGKVYSSGAPGEYMTKGKDGNWYGHGPCSR